MSRSSSLSPSRRAFAIRPRSLAMGSSLLSERYTVPDEVGSTTRIAGFLAAVALAAGCAMPAAEREPARSGPLHAVWVVDHGWHTAIVVRRDQVDPALWPEVRDFRVARALRQAGLDVTPAGTVTAGGVMQQARRLVVSR